MSYDVCPASDYVSQDFGCTSFPEWNAPWCPSKNYHSGIDLGSTTYDLFRKPVFATRSGAVVAVGSAGDVDWGFPFYLGSQAVCLKAGTAYIIYAHLDQASVTLGQTVQVGAQIGLVGSRGNSTGPHLHFEVRTDGARQNVWGQASAVLDPRPYLNKLTGGTAGSEVIVEDAMDQATFDALLDSNHNFQALIWRVKTLLDHIDAVEAGPTKGETNQLKAALAGLKGAPGATGPAGPAGISPTHFTISGTAEAV